MSLSKRGFAGGLLVVLLSSLSAWGATVHIRWEAGQTQLTDTLAPIVEALNKESGLSLTAANFVRVENRELANSRFQNYFQVNNGVPIKGAMIRTWARPDSGALVLMEAHLDNGAFDITRQSALRLRRMNTNLKSKLNNLNTMKYVRQVVSRHSDDRLINDVKQSDQWNGTDLVRVIEVTGRRGVHTIAVSHFTQKVVSATYEEHPQFDIPALVYPIYEETEKDKTRQERIPVVLKHLNDKRLEADSDPYAPLRARRYFEDMIDPVLGETQEGQAQGFWSPNWLLREARRLLSLVPETSNTFSNGGAFLLGKYATINIHPEAIAKYQGLSFTPTYSGRLSIGWTQSTDTGRPRWEVLPRGAFYGRPLLSADDSLSRSALRLPDHDVVSYMNSGFDEIQVYYAINRLMESLQGMGFTDPELSTRAFHAFLYDPDIGMRDNAYYTNDTINFTTYSPGAQNAARDNGTIWHELGHGVMDRLMGDYLVLNDSGGLAEGMADFVSQLVIHDVTEGNAFDGSKDFRIINNTGFNLTNESHDDGEAYGGAMNDILLLAVNKYGREGLRKVTDLTLESMRLARNHPGLTANDWFETMLFADRLGRAGVRESGEMRSVILSALETRNFRLDRGPIAKFDVKFDGSVLTDQSLGSRYNTINHVLTPGAEATHQLEFNLVPSEYYKFEYPVTLVVSFNGGPLQGAVKWKDEDKGPIVLTLNSPDETVTATVGAVAGCDSVNREDGSCADFAYLQVFNKGATKAFAKKRFYLRIGAR